jgi:hypothetical protein
MKYHPMIFNGALIPRLLDGSKTMTRRLVKEIWQLLPLEIPAYQKEALKKCPFGQIRERIYVRETWAEVPGEGYVYRATDPEWGTEEVLTWRPSIHMPRAASRITLEITGLKVERLGDISEEDALAEGCSETEEWRMWSIFTDRCTANRGGEEPVIGEDEGFGKILAYRDQVVSPHRSARDAFQTLWNSIYGYDSWTRDKDKFVWAISFKRLKEE